MYSNTQAKIIWDKYLDKYLDKFIVTCEFKKDRFSYSN